MSRPVIRVAVDEQEISASLSRCSFGCETVSRAWPIAVAACDKLSIKAFCIQLSSSDRNAHQHSSTTPRPAQTPTPARTPAPGPTSRPTDAPLPRLLLHNLLLLRRALFLSLPMTSLLVVLANPKRPPKPLALFDLSFRKLVDLMAFETSCAGSAAVARLLGREFLAQGVALVVYCVFVHAGRKKY